MHTPYKILLPLCGFLFLCLPLQSQEKIIKSIEKNYSLSQAGKLKIQNAYGHLAISSWDKDSVQIIVDIRVTHKKKENAQSLMDRVAPKFEEAKDYISITTEIKEKSQSFFSKYVIKETPLDFSRGNLEINYTIKLPQRASLEIDNKFGDVVLEDWQGNLKASIEHGDIFLSQQMEQINLSMAYGKIKGRMVDYASIELKNGSLDIENTKKLRLNSRGSTIKLNQVIDLELYSNKDEITIDSLDAIRGDLKFTTLKISKADSLIDLSMKISDFEVNQIGQPNATIIIKQEDSEVKLNITGISFNFDALLEEGLLRLPKSFTNIQSRVLDKVKKIREIEATYGNKKEGRVSIHGSKGAVILNDIL
ncbi:MAG: hypothetical protein WBN69_02250 [Eudoraea sp.]